MGLFCIAADAVHGPQVTYDGLPLVGRDMAEPESDTIAYAEANDVQFRITAEVTRHRMIPGSSCARNRSERPSDRVRCSWSRATARGRNVGVGQQQIGLPGP